MNFLGMGPMELLLILVIALIVFGPHKLPELMGQAGKAIRDFRRATSDITDEFNRTLQAELAETKAVVEETKAALEETRAALAETTQIQASAAAPAPGSVNHAEVASTVAATTPYASGTANGLASETAAAEPDAFEASAATALPGQEAAATRSGTPAASTPAQTPDSSSAQGPGAPSLNGTSRPKAADDDLLPPY